MRFLFFNSNAGTQLIACALAFVVRATRYEDPPVLVCAVIDNSGGRGGRPRINDCALLCGSVPYNIVVSKRSLRRGRNSENGQGARQDNVLH